MSEAPNLDELEPIAVGTKEAARLCGMGRGNFSQMVYESFSTDDPVPFIPRGETQRLYPVRELREWIARRAKRAVDEERKAKAAVRAMVDAKR